MHKHPLIWLTRPRADSESVAGQLHYHGIHSIISPVMHIVPRPHTPLPDVAPAAILLTSRHAAYTLSEIPAGWRRLPVYCIGASTAKIAVEHGCTQIVPGTADIMSLLPHIATNMKSGSELLYLAGQDTRNDVAALLATHSINVTKVIVYDATAETRLSEELVAAIHNNELDAVAFYSPRSAEIACELLIKAGLADAARHIRAFCLSLAVADAAGKLPFAQIHACHTPSRSAMRELIVSQLTKTM